MSNKNINESIELLPLINLYALDVICGINFLNFVQFKLFFILINICIYVETAMGTSINAQINSDTEYIHAVKELNNKQFNCFLYSTFIMFFFLVVLVA